MTPELLQHEKYHLFAAPDAHIPDNVRRYLLHLGLSIHIDSNVPPKQAFLISQSALDRAPNHPFDDILKGGE